MTHHDGFAPVIDASSMHYSTPSTIRPHTSDWYICTHCDISHDDSAHFGATNDVMVDDSNTYDSTFTSPTVLEDSSTYDSATHALVVPSASDQYVITDPLPRTIEFVTTVSSTRTDTVSQVVLSAVLMLRRWELATCHTTNMHTTALNMTKHAYYSSIFQRHPHETEHLRGAFQCRQNLGPDPIHILIGIDIPNNTMWFVVIQNRNSLTMVSLQTLN